MPTARREAGASPATKPFLSHLEELRRTLLACLAALAAGMAVAAPLAPRIFGWLQRPLEAATGEAEPFLRTIAVGGAFQLAVRVIFWSGMLLAAPVILARAAAFVSPGLTARERRAVRSASGFAALLFVLGVGLGYAVTLPVALRVMLGINRWLGLRAEWVATSYAAFALQLLLAFGLVFELPVVLLVLGRLGVVSSRQLREKRSHVIVALLVTAMLLTPPDIFTQILMAAPLVLMYEVCIWLIRSGERGTGA